MAVSLTVDLTRRHKGDESESMLIVMGIVFWKGGRRRVRLDENRNVIVSRGMVGLEGK